MHEMVSFPYVISLHVTVGTLRKWPLTISSYFCILLDNLFIKPKVEKQEEVTAPRMGMVWRRLPGFTRTNNNPHSDLGFQLISYKYTPSARYQGSEWVLLERQRNRPQKQSRALLALQKITQSAHCKWEIMFSCSHWMEGQMILLKLTLHLKVLGGNGKWYFIFL